MLQTPLKTKFAIFLKSVTKFLSKHFWFMGKKQAFYKHFLGLRNAVFTNRHHNCFFHLIFWSIFLFYCFNKPCGISHLVNKLCVKSLNDIDYCRLVSIKPIKIQDTKFLKCRTGLGKHLLS